MIQSRKWDGKPITEPGIYADIPGDAYHSHDICDGPSVSSSQLRMLWAKSPAHCWLHHPANPKRAVEKLKAEYIIGRAAHHLICGQAHFAREFIVRPEYAPDGRDWHHANKSCIKWMEEHKKLTVLTPDMVEAVKGMAISLGGHRMIQAGILNGLVERALFVRDRETGIWLKSKPDTIPSDSGDFADLKTTPSVLYLDVQRSIAEFNYHMQGAMVLDVARELGMEVASFSLIWVEKVPPYCVRVQQLKDEDLARGSRANRMMIRLYARCWNEQHWPGPGDDQDDAEYVDLPDWKRKQIDDRLQHALREAA